MAKKNPIPNDIAGVKVPKPLRKSKVLRAMLASKVGRDMLANAMTAGAGAAAAVLLDHRDDVDATARTATKKSTKALDLAADALQSGVSAAMDVVRDTIVPGEKKKKAKKRKASKGHSATSGVAVH